MNSSVLIPSRSISSSLSNQFLTAEVKLCVSRRPWNVFEDTFNTRPCLRLEKLTYGDIRYYYSSSLSDNLGFATLQRGDPNAASDLVENVSTKACSVFLYAILVINTYSKV
ncbi:uncharacterized protein K444DRAFT_692793 [Hyaloscypha bicolor E]|uniref:Uncharacterized protein n=1 Tax=Hyaloscypha bicolor E TaxID=1095630 RepID=A0A2J6T2S8_9HELO|nr:uncharacterized protein K444DRAFT_692793 [Hyaloscypha bicolor E]PMD57223.1 hypothetical protein K444DRAFT_692793 [Hyaloscypha bicolor E]